MLRELVHETTGTGAIDDSTWTGALSLSGKFVFGKDDVRWMGMYGNLGRYVGLNFANDAVLDGSGDLDGSTAGPGSLPTATSGRTGGAARSRSRCRTTTTTST